MASSTLLKLILTFLVCFFLSLNKRVDAQIEETTLNLMSDSLEFPTTMSLYDEEDMDGGDLSRRSLFWSRVKYYISYGALSANRIPCPPRSGRSYYTHNCYKARGPVHPYSRGCSVITRCRR
ncbi:protein RALF-like 34 [Cicer arietinum]|uniref:Protein RALF-like 34 n=1 Tax=Cicer arietinum TaxID=3827 RepID=A0A1S2YYG4_CICAR|nr:protein RALF-like 34 [Cicer arietinum]